MVLVMLPILLLVTAVELWMTRQEALESANAAYDRSLLGALKSIDANISTASGGLSVELPYTMFEFFELTASGQVFFRVATSDGLVELGSADLPPPPQAPPVGVPVFYDASYFGESVRLVAYYRVLERTPTGAEERGVMVQVGESTRSRQAFTERFVRSAAIRDAIVLGFLMLGAAAVLRVALSPLARLARDVEARPPEDLTQIDNQRLPAEISPLVGAVNHHMARIQDLMALQRQFLDDASHQLRTHLTTLQMQVDYAKREADPHKIRQALEALSDEVGRASRSSQQLLTLGRSDAVPVSMAAFELEPLLREVALSGLPQARAKRIDLGIQTPSPGASALGDRTLLREALSNLVSNAIAYSRAEGRVTVYATSNEQGWTLNVEDDGPGLSEAERATLGQRFRRGAQASKGGFGLGLAIARSIAERHGGQLRLEEPASGQGLHAVIAWPPPPVRPAGPQDA
ncbi:sensor histidine kinase N-terminal domain-containing protein [Curvibacter sp. HBC61]|uniref:histidine kinase n=1 Tax=Curvibacter cyanobacteriorum TaxID=3026422 RepID=A0ABT5N105_9BURK|nr:sensor histidine kinase [Curvibacter sp. HBC61]MDD0839728.1 sensor histidine kinase N-terminal domain-containing protein [Curvibacter sp. HBC61]